MQRAPKADKMGKLSKKAAPEFPRAGQDEQVGDDDYNLKNKKKY